MGVVGGEEQLLLVPTHSIAERRWLALSGSSIGWVVTKSARHIFGGPSLEVWNLVPEALKMLIHAPHGSRNPAKSTLDEDKAKSGNRSGHPPRPGLQAERPLSGRSSGVLHCSRKASHSRLGRGPRNPPREYQAAIQFPVRRQISANSAVGPSGPLARGDTFT